MAGELGELAQSVEALGKSPPERNSGDGFLQRGGRMCDRTEGLESP